MTTSLSKLTIDKKISIRDETCKKLNKNVQISIIQIRSVYRLKRVRWEKGCSSRPVDRGRAGAKPLMFRKSSRGEFLSHNSVEYVKVVLRQRIDGNGEKDGQTTGTVAGMKIGQCCHFVWSLLLTRCRCDRNEHREQAIPSFLERRMPALEENTKRDNRQYFRCYFSQFESSLRTFIEYLRNYCSFERINFHFKYE